MLHLKCDMRDIISHSLNRQSFGSAYFIKKLKSSDEYVKIERSIAVKRITKFFKWMLALPFSIIEFAFTILWAFAPIIQKLTVLFDIYIIWDGYIKRWLDKKDYLSFIDFIIFSLVLLFSQQIFAWLMELCRKVRRKIRFGVPFSESVQPHNYSYHNASGDQRVTLTVNQLRELMNGR